MIIYNGKNSEIDFNILVASKEIPTPQRKEITETVPYMSGLWDFSFHDGVDEYEAVTLVYAFDVIADTKQELNAEKARLLQWLHGSSGGRLYDTDISLTKCYEVYNAKASWSEDGLQGLLTAEFLCYPFMKTDKETGAFELSATGQLVTIDNGGSRAVTPTLKIASKNLVQNYVVPDNATQYKTCLFVKGELKPDTVYTLSFIGAEGHNIYLNEYLFVETGFYLLTGKRQSITVTTKSNISTQQRDVYDENGWIIAKNRGGNTVTPAFTNVQIEEGRTATDYEPYVEANATISDSGNTYSLNAGTHTGVLTLKTGENALTVSGEGLLSIAYTEEAF